MRIHNVQHRYHNNKAFAAQQATRAKQLRQAQNVKYKCCLLIDCNYLMYRAHYSCGQLQYRDNLTGALYGFFRELVELTGLFQPDGIAFCFDSKYSKRKEVYPEYKANRKKPNPKSNPGLTDPEIHEQFMQQIEDLRRKYLPRLYNNVFCQKGYEADDLIASLCNTLEGNLIIVSADQDLYQCLGLNVKMWNPTKHKMFDHHSFHAKFGILPAQWSEVKSIAGCSSDNIKGIHKVGTKLAVKWLKGKLKPDGATYKLIMKDIGIVTTNLKLINLPFPGVKKMELVDDDPSEKVWKRMCRELGFQSLIRTSPMFQYSKGVK